MMMVDSGFIKMKTEISLASQSQTLKYHKRFDHSKWSMVFKCPSGHFKCCDVQFS